MSRNPNIRMSTWLQTPAELLLDIVSKMDHSSRINAVVAYPEVFLRPGFNIFLQDAEDQVRRQNRHTDPTVPLFVARSMRPLLYQAMEDNINISAIEGMLRVYTDFFPTSIDGVWGQSPTTLPPPLIHAASLGRPRVVSLLLDMGANPLLRCGPHNYRVVVPADCHLVAFSHEQCQPLNPATQPQRTNCTTAIAAALFKGIEVRTIGHEHQDLDECALLLYKAGAPIPAGGSQFNPAVDTALEQQLYFPIRAGFCSLLRAILGPLLPLRQRQLGFRTVLYYGLTCAVNFQKNDDFRNVIEYLVSIGSLLVDPNNTLPYFDNTHAHLASAIGHTKTANFLLNQYINQGFILEYGGFGLYRSGDTLTFVQTLYKAMRSGGYLQYEAVSSKDLHEFLLGQAIRCKDDASVQWLVDQNVGTLINVHYAIAQDNIVALRALIGAGLSADTLTSMTVAAALRFGFYMGRSAKDTPGETPLNLALRLKRMEMACFLIYHGAKPSLVSDEVKKELVRDFPVRYKTPYAGSSPKATPAMFPREYWATYDLDRLFNMFRYILE
ncbi:hypothetical protein F4782DRAFT_550543 [Xylaria castorea]|nr:hypothetical protein F4782DRAFT_550543 [Xylaria castorea]